MGFAATGMEACEPTRCHCRTLSCSAFGGTAGIGENQQHRSQARSLVLVYGKERQHAAAAAAAVTATAASVVGRKSKGSPKLITDHGGALARWMRLGRQECRCGVEEEDTNTKRSGHQCIESKNGSEGRTCITTPSWQWFRPCPMLLPYGQVSRPRRAAGKKAYGRILFNVRCPKGLPGIRRRPNRTRPKPTRSFGNGSRKLLTSKRPTTNIASDHSPGSMSQARSICMCGYNRPVIKKKKNRNKNMVPIISL